MKITEYDSGVAMIMACRSDLSRETILNEICKYSKPQIGIHDSLIFSCIKRAIEGRPMPWEEKIKGHKGVDDNDIRVKEIRTCRPDLSVKTIIDEIFELSVSTKHSPDDWLTDCTKRAIACLPMPWEEGVKNRKISELNIEDERRKMDYLIISDKSISTLATNVQRCLDSGYEVSGGIAVDGNWYRQVVVRKKKVSTLFSVPATPSEKAMRYKDTITRIMACRPDLTEDDLCREINKMTIPSLCDHQETAIKCLKLVMIGDPLPWENKKD